MAQTNWLGELVLHGDDIARSAGVPWEIRERDMLLLLRGMMEAVSAYVRDDISRTTDICVALQIPEARPYVIPVHDGIAEWRARRLGDRPDDVLRSPGNDHGPNASSAHRPAHGREAWPADCWRSAAVEGDEVAVLLRTAVMQY